VLEVELRPLERGERREAAGVCARGMRDNPIHCAVFGPDPEQRVAATERLFRALFAVAAAPPRVAVRAGHIVGVAGASPPGACRLSPPAIARVLASVARGGVAPLRRSLVWLEAWGRRDPETPHWHVGPVAVEGGLQGLGIGSQLLAALAADLDAAGATAWLETDKPGNVGFYRRFGFEVVEEAAVYTVPCWFMRRTPGVRPGR
jgi:ribosomal protein S18 acetylase RimI-like enzyme